MTIFEFFLGAFLVVVVFSVLLALTYFLARARVEEAEARVEELGG